MLFVFHSRADASYVHLHSFTHHHQPHHTYPHTQRNIHTTHRTSSSSLCILCKTMALSNPPHTGKHHPTTITKLFIKLLTIKHFNKITAEQQTMANYMDFGWSSANVRDTPTFTFSANSTFGGVHNALYTHTHTHSEIQRERATTANNTSLAISFRHTHRGLHILFTSVGCGSAIGMFVEQLNEQRRSAMLSVKNMKQFVHLRVQTFKLRI